MVFSLFLICGLKQLRSASFAYVNSVWCYCSNTLLIFVMTGNSVSIFLLDIFGIKLFLRCMFTSTWAEQLQMWYKSAHAYIYSLSMFTHKSIGEMQLLCYILNYLVLHSSMCSPNTHKWAADQNIAIHYSESIAPRVLHFCAFIVVVFRMRWMLFAIVLGNENLLASQDPT